VIFDLYHAGMLPLSSLLLTIFCGLGIIAAGIALSRLRISISLGQFSVILLLVSALCAVLPASAWLFALAVLLSALFAGGIALALIVRSGKIRTAVLNYKYSPRMAFVGVKDSLTVQFQDNKKSRGSLIRTIIMRFLEIDIDGTDSVHCETIPSGRIPFFFEENSLRDSVPVLFMLRGHDRGATLYGSILLRKPFSFFFPWRQRITWDLPDIPVLSTSFAPLAGKTVLSRLDDRMKRRATRKESRIRTDAFLHLGLYSPGEPLSQIDFRASMKTGQIISRKFAHTIDMTCLVAVGFGRRAQASGSGEYIISALGRVLAENVSMGIASEVLLFDIGTRIRKNVGLGSRSALHFGSEVAELNPSHFEEDEYCILDKAEHSVGEYTHLRIITAWGGTFDPSRAISAASVFRKQGIQCEIQVIAPEVLATLEDRKGSDSSRFFMGIMDQYAKEAQGAGITLVWNPH